MIRSICVCLFIVLLWLTLFASPLHAQDGIEVQPIALTNISGELYFDLRYRDKDETQSNNVETKQTDLIFEEGLTFNLGGYAYHPNLVDWYGSVTFGLSQQETQINDDSLKTDGTILRYSLTALMLKEKFTSARVYANKSDRIIDRSFARSIKYDGQVIGGEVYTKGDIPLSLTVEYSTIEETSAQRIDDEDTFSILFEASDFRHPDWLTDLIFTHEDTDETQTPFLSDGSLGVPIILDDTINELNVTNTWGMGQGPPGNKRIRLNGQLIARQRSGFFNEDLLALSQTLSLLHNETLTSTYLVNFRYDDTDIQTDQFISGRASVNQQIYNSLNIDLSAFASDRQLDTGSEQLYGGTASFVYTKQTPIGVYSNNLAFDYRVQQDSFPQGNRLISREPVTLVISVFVPLAETNVVPGSVVVTNLALSVTYIEGIDYELRETGAITEIRSLIGGNIADGQTVFVSYSVFRAPESGFSTTFITNRQIITLKDLPATLYFDYRYLDEELQSGDDPGNLEHEETFVFGGDFYVLPFEARLEYESSTLRLSPSYDRFRADLRYGERLSKDISFNLAGYFDTTQYRNGEDFGLTEGEDFVDKYGASANVTTKLHRTLLLQLEGQYLNSKGRINESLTRAGASFTWNYGQTNVILRGYQEFWEQESADGTRLLVDLRLTRRF